MQLMPLDNFQDTTRIQRTSTCVSFSSTARITCTERRLVAKLGNFATLTLRLFLRLILFFRSMQQVVDTSKLTDSTETFIKRQSGFTFGFIITLSFSSAHSDYSRRLTNEFQEASTQNIRYIGGNPEYFSMENSSNWSRTIKDNPSLIQFELKEISELIEDERKRLDMHKAIIDYIESNAPPGK